MTLTEAVAILNAKRHHGHSGWYIPEPISEDSPVYGQDFYEYFEPFEAIAIAKWYIVGDKAQ